MLNQIRYSEGLPESGYPMIYIWLVFAAIIGVAVLLFYLAAIGQGADWAIENFYLPVPKLRRWNHTGFDATVEPSDSLSDKERGYYERYDDLWYLQFCYSWLH